MNCHLATGCRCVGASICPEHLSAWSKNEKRQESIQSVCSPQKNYIPHLSASAADLLPPGSPELPAINDVASAAMGACSDTVKAEGGPKEEGGEEIVPKGSSTPAEAAVECNPERCDDASCCRMLSETNSVDSEGTDGVSLF